jgi:hypothetical protein
MYVCGPMNKIKMTGNFHTNPHRDLKISLLANYDVIQNKTKVDETIN